MEKSLIIIPTFNERENIEQLVTQIMQLYNDFQICIVDDESKDGTAQVIDELSLKYEGKIHPIHRKGKKGFGSAAIEGINFGLKNGYDPILTMDADLSHQPQYLKDFLEASKNADMVIGSRYLNGISIVNWPLRRLFLSLFANRYVKFITGIKLTDFTSGFRCYRSELLKKIALEDTISSGYSFLAEITVRSDHLNARIKEIPIIFIERRNGVSKINYSICLEAAILPLKLKLKKILGTL